MKTTLLFKNASKICFCLIILLSACEKPNKEPSAPRMRLNITNSSGDYEQLNVYIQSVQLQYKNVQDSEGWKTLACHSGLYNLMMLKDGSERQLVSDQELPAGKITGVRLFFADSSSIMTNADHVVTNIPLSDTARYGVIVPVENELALEKEIVVTLSINGATSVKEDGHPGAYRLDPSIHVKTMYSRTGNFHD